ncbi:MAG: mechanosensitive ion channel family protein [Desulfofustis sp.]|nr:mechanosensitive ion channel family protein [Desulfofustis sp.]NNK57640.1 mechanosensitive ion channel family protein [Desulfofustis sp.]
MAEELPIEEQIDEIADTTFLIFDKLGNYGAQIAGSLYLVVGAMLVIFLIHRLAGKLIYPHIKNKRFIRVLFGTLYVMVLVIMALLILDRIGVPVEGIAHLALAGVLIGSVVVFFMVPFIPKLPFFIGHTVEIGGIFGTVSAIDVFRVTIKQFDGTSVTLPTAMVMASTIKNFSEIPHRRVEIMISVNNDSDLEQTRRTFIEVMGADSRVLEEPIPPATHIVNANASGVDMLAFCWVKNEDWFSARTDLWLKMVHAFNDDERISMSLPQQEIFVHSDVQS